MRLKIPNKNDTLGRLHTRKHTPEKATFARMSLLRWFAMRQHAFTIAPRPHTKFTLFRCEAVLPMNI